MESGLQEEFLPLWGDIKNGPGPFRILCIRVPYYFGDTKKEPEFRRLPTWGLKASPCCWHRGSISPRRVKTHWTPKIGAMDAPLGFRV